MGKRFLLQRLVQGTPVGLSNFSHEKYSHCEVSWVSEGQKEWVRSMISKGQGWINPTANCLSFGTSILCIPHFWNWSCLTKNSKFASWKIQSCLTKISKLSHKIWCCLTNFELSHEKMFQMHSMRRLVTIKTMCDVQMGDHMFISYGFHCLANCWLFLLKFFKAARTVLVWINWMQITAIRLQSAQCVHFRCTTHPNVYKSNFWNLRV